MRAVTRSDLMSHAHAQMTHGATLADPYLHKEFVLRTRSRKEYCSTSCGRYDLRGMRSIYPRRSFGYLSQPSRESNSHRIQPRRILVESIVTVIENIGFECTVIYLIPVVAVGTSTGKGSVAVEFKGMQSLLVPPPFVLRCNFFSKTVLTWFD